MKVQPIKIWRFYDAPMKYQNLSEHGGDEDWVAEVPKKIYIKEWLGFLRPGTNFGCSDVSTHKLKDKVILIGAHA